jgi:serine/threonine-protein kinase
VIENRYKELEKISETLTNIVYKIRDRRTDRILALKVLKKSEPEYISQFRREFCILQTVTHPNIAKAYSFGTMEDNGERKDYFTMEYVEGLPFTVYFKRNNLRGFLDSFVDTLRVLNFVHYNGYLHCDLKPHHILVDRERKIKLIDFGFAQLQKDIILMEIGGTLRYLAPEILRG